MKDVDYLIIHSTNTSEALSFGKDVIIKKHTESTRNNGLGFNRPGFDYLIPFDGSLQVIINEDNPTQTDLWGISNGLEDLTGISKNIAYVGGRTLKEAWDKDTRTDAQKQTLETIVRFYVLRFPNIVILGFNEVPTKVAEDSPAFSVGDWLRSIAIPEKNIYQKPKDKNG
ncbi:N-acetylmuramoyl-L-alanine amidase [Kordia sp.]|uniref:N-acetylmuramoyl-L-alanine amidase n=1 Tax=Kordia sp. TaxID=1965332 RepID=UPI003D2BB465